MIFKHERIEIAILRFSPHAGETHFNESSKLNNRAAYSKLLSSYVLLRHGLGPNTTIYHTKKGKPYIKKPNTFISKSHTDLAVAVCIHNTNIGIDIERFDPAIDISCARSFMHSIEYNRFTELRTDDERYRFFFSCWVVKEAIVKFLGTGFLTNPTAILNSDYPTAIEIFNGEYFIACCAESSPRFIIDQVDIQKIHEILGKKDISHD